ncbi:MerR family transcriptional regulator [Chryseosolibacter indicus]|uniref:MerR family transcriptional regulator n=1 Tax=Chryseosolibacter indicus TaxID=2782351 RepID=A0ABS5VW77_9BACT|nr:MerR family transcriptional regulator [Chryseosolibacter indicus]MBT1705677.1 MerR family transcriptional regulator [Chryseosolibacter indicus]
MGTYSIKELEQLSGIKAHTIRIWEKRHKLIEPSRTNTNIRYYSDYDLKKIINVSLLNNNGFKISAIARMNEAELIEKVIELSNSGKEKRIYIDQLVTQMLDLDEEKFEAELDGIETKFGFEATITEVIYPFLEKIGVLWQTGNITPAHEHFISNLVRQRLIVGIASLPVASKATIRAVLFLPEHELHEIALLFFHYITRKAGFKTFYLGQSVPHEDLKTVCSIHKPHLLITSLTTIPTINQLNAYLQKLSSDFPSSKILATGSMLRKASFHFPSNLKFFKDAFELKSILAAMK